MNIHNVRLGLATNSSSSHSLLLGLGQRDVPPEYGSGEYGWDRFVLASQSAKTGYLAHLLYINAKRVMSDDMAQVIAEAISGHRMECDGDGNPIGHIDHQSVYDLPRAWDGRGLDLGFAEDLRAFLGREDLAIVGGNDNDDIGDGRGFVLPLPRDIRCCLVARRDPSGYWALFNRDTGAKIRMSFAEPDKKLVVDRASAPELVDVKITDRCLSSCAFCYQDSGPAGAHAKREDMQRLAWALGEMRCFEVALGGGEPTLHPEFVQILRAFRGEHVVPNFTTRQTAWLSGPFAQEIFELAGAVAFSVRSSAEIAAIAKLVPDDKWASGRAVTQYVLGVDPLERLKEILAATREARMCLTLLGYKPVGRAAKIAPHDYKGWTDVVAEAVKASACPYISIDTALAAESMDALKAAGVPGWCYHVKEGAFSMYVDAVRGLAAPSSYEGEKAFAPIDFDAGKLGTQVLTAFRGFTETAMV